MRHVWSLLAGLGVAVAAFFIFSLDLTYAQVRFGDPYRSDLLILQLVVAGLLLGSIGSTRVSPTGPILAGLLLVLPVALSQLLPDVFEAVFPGDARIAIGEVVRFVPAQGASSQLVLVTGVMLLMAAASPGRWRRWPQPAPAAGTVEPVVDTGRIDAVAAWRPFSADTSESTVRLAAPGEQPPLAGPWAPPPSR